MKKCLSVSILLLLLTYTVKAQDTLSVNNISETIAVTPDSSLWIKDSKINAKIKEREFKPAFKPDPTKAIIYSAILPGMGQIYNRKYWKLPIIYGGLLGLVYGITWNGQYYTDYKEAYTGVVAEDPRSDANFKKWKDMAPFSYRDKNITDSQIQTLRLQFKRKKDVYRRNRDLCIIGVIGVYAISMIDAYVDAHLFDFNVSPDLSMRLEPIVSDLGSRNNRSVGLQCSIQF